MPIQPHDYVQARNTALALRRQAWQELWRDADAVWTRISLDAAARLARSTRRWEARLAQHHAQRARMQLPCG